MMIIGAYKVYMLFFFTGDFFCIICISAMSTILCTVHVSVRDRSVPNAVREFFKVVSIPKV